MKWFRINDFGLVFVMATVLVTGCQTSPRIFTEHDPEMDFAGYNKYTILPLPDTVPGGEPGLMLRLREPAVTSIREAMKEQGFTEVEQENADFAVHLRGEINPKVKVTNWGYRGYSVDQWGRVSPYNHVEVDQYNEGALILEIYDVNSKELAWVGWIKGRSRSTDVNIEKFQEDVKAILRTFPPGTETE